MSTQRKTQVIVILDSTSRFTFPSVAKAKRFVDRMMHSHQITVEFN